MNIINLTPHVVNVVKVDGTTQTFKPDGTVARIFVFQEDVDTVDGMLFTRPKFGQPAGVPAPVEGTIFIVSAMIREALKHRVDLVSPGELVRDDKGNVIGCKSFYVNY